MQGKPKPDAELAEFAGEKQTYSLRSSFLFFLGETQYYCNSKISTMKDGMIFFVMAPKCSLDAVQRLSALLLYVRSI